ncbi:MAG: aminofutalosine synthase MqnE [Chlamydiae bacterium]|nr:aminofutalosine synthase MqnE [Chlamydiota bacterium]MBI3276449.1 aminofutalosine synthase MqnE [Chlamydiota bacterium]
MNLLLEKSELSLIAEKVEHGKRLSFEEGLTLFRSRDLNGIGALANLVREKKNGNKAYFVINLHIDYTNICAVDCLFCSFRRDLGHSEGYTLSIDQILKKIENVWDQGLTELHMVGGLHPELSYSYYLDLLSAIKKAYPTLHIKAFTCVEIDFFSQIYKKSAHEVLAEFKEAGLDSLPGGGAEIFDEKLRKKICGEKATGARWLQVAKTAHRLGIPTNATMLYGHLEKLESRVEHLLALRSAQDETGGFRCFIPLAYHPENNRMGKIGWTMGMDDLKTLAISRLLLDNFNHIKAYWVMLTPALSQVALSYGADDIDGSVIEEKIYHDAGAKTQNALTRETLIKLISDAGREPVERDAMYHESLRFKVESSVRQASQQKQAEIRSLSKG